MEKAASHLRSSLDVPSFARSARWSDFRDDADQLHTVLLDKVQEMKAAAAGEAERRGVPTEKKSAKQEARLVLAVHSGTPPMYATLETLLRQLDDYSVFVLEEEFILTLHPMSAEALAGRDPDGARRKHLERQSGGVTELSFSLLLWRCTRRSGAGSGS